MTPYLAFWVPEHLGGSGVLATVACGLYVSWNGPRLILSATRLQGIFFWDLLVYLVEGLVFLLTGSQARALLERVESFSFYELAIVTGWITLIVVAARFIWIFPATYIPIAGSAPRSRGAIQHLRGKDLLRSDLSGCVVSFPSPLRSRSPLLSTTDSRFRIAT
jgi:NhaP-type Na+/H+ or K+/H+ antiporter